MKFTKYIVLYVILIAPVWVSAVEIKPYPLANISVDQWKLYYQAVVKELGETKETSADQNLVVFHDKDEGITIAFTMEGHEAHPSWVTRYLVRSNGDISIAQIGYFAGEEAPFAKLFKQYQELTNNIRKEISASSISISHEKISEQHYKLILSSHGKLEVSVAQQELVPTAKKLCGELYVRFGKYEFNSQEPITEDASDLSEKAFILHQEIHCQENNPNSSVGSKKSRVPDQNKVKLKANKLTNKYFKALFKEKYKKSYSMLSPNMKSMKGIKTWTKERREYYSNFGKLTSIDIWRTTIYVDPPNAPKKGIYVAVDYELEFENIPIYCGYLVLQQLSKGKYHIVREEFGHLDSEMLSKFNELELNNFKSKLGCKI